MSWLISEERLLTTLASARLTRICVTTVGSACKNSILLTGRDSAWCYCEGQHRMRDMANLRDTEFVSEERELQNMCGPLHTKCQSTYNLVVRYIFRFRLGGRYLSVLPYPMPARSRLVACGKRGLLSISDPGINHTICHFIR
jgi:hypothetical protein